MTDDVKPRYIVEFLMDWQRIAQRAAFTQRIDNPPPITVKYLQKMIICEHSPLRAVVMSVRGYNIPYCDAAHLVRHEIGCFHDPLMSTQLPYAFNPVDYDRRKAPQDAPVDWWMDCNIQAFLNIMKKRLCIAAGPRINRIMQDIINEIRKQDDPLAQTLAWACRPACRWQGDMCHETFKGKLAPCGRFPVMKMWEDAEEWW